MKTRIFLTIFICVIVTSINAQISTKELPVTKVLNRVIELPNNVMAKKIMPAINMNVIEQEDISDAENGLPPRFGFPHFVSYNLNNSGQWTTLENGDKIWQLEISCPNALSINLLYDQFWLPEGAKLFIHNADKTKSIGAFTSFNNQGDKNNPHDFATGLVYGNKCILEYYVPNSITEQGIISIQYVIQGYRYINVSEATEVFNGSGNCQVNVNCVEGQNWQNEKNAVALILVNGNRYCTGSLINTTANDNRPLFLTADHCLGGWAQSVKGDAINHPNLSYWSFYWNYESPNCNNPTTEPSLLSTIGATVVANNGNSDFALLRLTEDPKLQSGITPYYLGWDRSGNAGTGGVGIHHPSGDVKKIATHNITPPINSNCMNFTNNEGIYVPNGNFWRINWIATVNGHSVTEGGSSGSPLFNNSHRVIGQLYGAGYCSNTNCSNPSADIANYGKFSVSWTGNGATDNRRKLQPWLDPRGTNPQTLDGTSVDKADLLIRDDQDDDGTEPNPRAIHWNSPDIWLAVLVNGTFQTISTLEIDNYASQNIYIAVRIKNIGNKASIGGNARLHVYWSKSATNSRWHASWVNPSWIFGLPRGAEITNSQGVPIQKLEPEEETTMYIPWYVPNNSQYLETLDNIFIATRLRFNWGFALLARVDDGNYTYGLNFHFLPTATFAKNSNNVAVDNGNLLLYREKYSELFAVNTPLEKIQFNQILKNGEYKLGDFAEVNVLLSNDLMAKLKKDGLKIIDENTVLLTSANTELNFEPLDEDGAYFVGAEVHFISDKMPELNDFNFDMTTYDGEETETMRFTAIRNADVYFKALAEASKTKVVRAKEEVTLTSNVIFDDADYTWYNEAGEKIGTGYQITLTPLFSQKYKIEILKIEDGFKSYDEVEVIVVDGVIKSLSPNPAQSYVRVDYKLSDNATAASIQVSDLQNIMSVSYPLSTTLTQQDISLSGFVPGNYIVKLIISGAVVDTKSLIIY
ncbi:MAG: serine protease [Prevotellaceae bacterium]|jgi:hypothetical protein|nr:serine protease [Prevotellaceae bacterium]